MATLTLGTTVLTFDVESPSFSEFKSEIARETLGGVRRTTLLWRKYRYAMVLEPIAVADYNALRDLWTAATTSATYPLFDFASWWPDANGVAVAMELGPHETPYGGPIGRASLVLTEVNPR